MAVLAQAAQHLGIQSDALDAENRSLTVRNEALATTCQHLADRLASLERTVEERTKAGPSLSERFWRWFFGVKDDEPATAATPTSVPAAALATAGAGAGAPTTAAAVAPGFVRHFQRFMPSRQGRKTDDDWYLDFLGPQTGTKRS